MSMYYMFAIIGTDDDTDYIDGYILSDDEPDIAEWAADRLPDGYQVLETEVRVCPSINWSLV